MLRVGSVKIFCTGFKFFQKEDFFLITQLDCDNVARFFRKAEVHIAFCIGSGLVKSCQYAGGSESYFGVTNRFTVEADDFQASRVVFSIMNARKSKDFTRFARTIDVFIIYWI